MENKTFTQEIKKSLTRCKKAGRYVLIADVLEAAGISHPSAISRAKNLLLAAQQAGSLVLARCDMPREMAKVYDGGAEAIERSEIAVGQYSWHFIEA